MPTKELSNEIGRRERVRKESPTGFTLTAVKGGNNKKKNKKKKEGKKIPLNKGLFYFESSKLIGFLQACKPTKSFYDLLKKFELSFKVTYVEIDWHYTVAN